MIAAINGIQIPYVYAIEVERMRVGDEGRTIGGKLRRDIVAIKRIWNIQTRPMTKDEAAPILDHLDSIMYSAVDFWLDEFGDMMRTVRAYASVYEERVSFGRGGKWYKDGKQLAITVEEQ